MGPARCRVRSAVPVVDAGRRNRGRDGGGDVVPPVLRALEAPRTGGSHAGVTSPMRSSEAIAVRDPDGYCLQELVDPGLEGAAGLG